MLGAWLLRKAALLASNFTLRRRFLPPHNCNRVLNRVEFEPCAASCCKPSRQRVVALPESCSITITALLHPVAPAVLDGESR